jgi:Tfp pilus assembly protein PilV
VSQAVVRRLLRRKRGSGYTLVELMMALALLTVSILGIVSMQKLMVVSSGHAKNLSIAQHIAQSWATHLELDANAWRQNLTEVTWLSNVDGGWVRPDYDDDLNFGAAFDGVGNPLKDTELASARFCTNVRLSWLYPDDRPVVGNGMMRAEIRVFWLREGERNIDVKGVCEPTVSTTTIGDSTDIYHFIYHVVGVRQHASI